MFNAGLILEGGGMRGIYTAGVLDFLMDQNAYFAYNYGVSAGVCHACSYLSRQRGRAFRTVTDYGRDRRYAGLWSLITTGNFFGVKMVYDEIPNRLIPFDYETFARKQEILYAVLTNCRTGEAEYIPVGDLRRDMPLIQASSSLPLLSRMVVIAGTPYLDGGVADSIPIGRSIEDGHVKNIVILTRHRGYRKDPHRMMTPARIQYRAFPRLVHAIETRHERYNAALDTVLKDEAEGRAFVIQPKAPLEIGRLEKDVSKLRPLYQMGFDDAASVWPALRAFLGEG